MLVIDLFQITTPSGAKANGVVFADDSEHRLLQEGSILQRADGATWTVCGVGVHWTLVPRPTGTYLVSGDGMPNKGDDLQIAEAT